MQVKKLLFAPRTGLALSLALNLILAVRLFTATDSDVCDCGVSIANKNDNTTSKLELIQQTPKEEEEEEQSDFYTIGIATGTDKVQAQQTFKKCQDTGKDGCLYPHAINERCRPWGHFYHTMYNKWLGPKYAKDDAEPFQFLEIGYFRGSGYDAYSQFLPQAEMHSFEIRCDCKEGELCAANNPRYDELLSSNRLQCGDASSVEFLDKTWKTHMKRDDAPPLMVVVEDGSHMAQHIVQSILFWFPKIQPFGLFFIEDILPLGYINAIKTEFLPQLMADVHFCGPDKNGTNALLNEERCFPTIQPLLASIQCEMHICVLERNDKPAMELTLDQMDFGSYPNALDKSKCNVFASS